MPFPDPGLSVPTLSPYQMQYRGLKFAGIDRTQPYQLQQLLGIDAADIEGGDVQRPLDQGEFVGLDVSKGRDITLAQIVQGTPAVPGSPFIPGTPAVPPLTALINLSTCPGFEAPIGSWPWSTTGTAAPGGLAMSQVAVILGGSGTYSGRCSTANLSTASGQLASLMHTIAASASTTYSVGFQFVRSGTAASTTLYAVYRDSGGAQVGSTTTLASTSSANGRLTATFATPPLTATISFQLAQTSTASGQTYDSSYDNLIVVQGSSLPSYFDGDVAGYAWTGTAELSTSYSPGVPAGPDTPAVPYTPAGSVDTARQVLGGVLTPAGNTEYPLYLQLPSGLHACMARPRKHTYGLGLNQVFAKGDVATTLFHATDPRWYAVPTKSASVGLPAALGGLTFNVTFNASFGGGGSGGFLSVVNGGQMEMRPVFVITGPCTNPTIQNLSLSGSPQLTFNIVLNAGDTLTVDTDFQTATLITAGSTAGSSRRNTLAPGSTWFNLPPGTSSIEFTTTDALAAATLTCLSADAWMSL